MKKAEIQNLRTFSAIGGAISTICLGLVVLSSGSPSRFLATTFAISLFVFALLLWGIRSRKAIQKSAKNVIVVLENNWLFGGLLILLTISAIFAANILRLLAFQPETFATPELAARIMPLALWTLIVSASTIWLAFSLKPATGRRLFERFANLSPISIALLSFILVFLLIYLPFFLFEESQLELSFEVPMPDAIGNDLDRYLGWSRALFETGRYTGAYPPFPLIFFYPLTSLDFNDAYKVIVSVATVAFMFLAFVYPRLVTKSAQTFPFMLLWGAAGLFSYGLTFELQAGQYNLLTFTFCALAIYLFHFRSKLRPLAYVLFSIALQLKLWPGIFILMLVNDWRKWKENLIRFAAILLANLAALFIFGIDGFRFFVQSISSEHLPNFWVGNHSPVSYFYQLGNNSAWVAENLSWLSGLFFVAVLVLFLAVVVQAIRRNQRGFNPYLLLGCTLAAFLIPSLSNDYKLPVLIAPLILVFALVIPPRELTRRALFVLCLFGISLAYSVMHYSYGFKPEMLDNNFLLLFLMLLLTPVLYSLSPAKKERR